MARINRFRWRIDDHVVDFGPVADLPPQFRPLWSWPAMDLFTVPHHHLGSASA